MYAGECTTSALLTRVAERRENHCFVKDGASSLTYGAAYTAVAACAGGLRSLGVGRGDRVVVHLTNRTEYAVVMLAAHALGAVSVHANVLYSPEEMAYLIKDADPAVVVTEEALAGKLGAAGAGRAVVGLGEVEGAVPWPELLASAPLASLVVDGVTPDDPATVIYTSGTTAHPKGVVQRQATHGFAGEFMARNVGLSEDDVYLCIMPLFHSNATNMALSPMLVVGGTLVLSPFSASGFEEALHAHGATVTSGGAPHWRMVLAHLGERASEPDPESRLRVTLSGMPLADEEYEAFERRFGCRIVEMFGQTEALVPPTIRPPFGPHRWRSGGKVALGTEVRIWTEDGREGQPGEVGELQYRSGCAGGRMLGYLNQPEESAAVVTDDGWMRSRDLARVDEDGFVYFVDRLKDMLKVGGENVAASEVERVLNEHPQVAESAVVGLPDPMLGHVVRAFVVPAADELDPDALIAYCAERLAKFKVPEVVSSIAALPRTATGKVAKYLLPED